MLASLAPDRPAIVLTHDPVWFKDVPPGPFLTLAGHTHGGQIKLPGLGVVTNASRAPQRWSHGLVVEGGRHLIVTAGLGTGRHPAADRGAAGVRADRGDWSLTLRCIV